MKIKVVIIFLSKHHLWYCLSNTRVGAHIILFAEVKIENTGNIPHLFLSLIYII